MGKIKGKIQSKKFDFEQKYRKCNILGKMAVIFHTWKTIFLVEKTANVFKKFAIFKNGEMVFFVISITK